MMRPKRVALVSTHVVSRRALSDYLLSIGFDVDEHAELSVPTSYSGIVLVAKDDAEPEALKSQIRGWMKAKMLRVVVVTSRPTALRELSISHNGRLVVLAAPAFGWDVADGLRGVEPGSMPPGA